MAGELLVLALPQIGNEGPVFLTAMTSGLISAVGAQLNAPKKSDLQKAADGHLRWLLLLSRLFALLSMAAVVVAFVIGVLVDAATAEAIMTASAGSGFGALSFWFRRQIPEAREFALNINIDAMDRDQQYLDRATIVALLGHIDDPDVRDKTIAEIARFMVMGPEFMPEPPRHALEP
ncbi:hypothetical protein ACFYT3_31440 [Nocardia amikacinitolerans]|uniref:hypothetical protein n=1 Tax=Nocardia amikacinitolerans TaxID=756689 RepID=UPI0036B9CF84